MTHLFIGLNIFTFFFITIKLNLKTVIKFWINVKISHWKNILIEDINIEWNFTLFSFKFNYYFSYIQYKTFWCLLTTLNIYWILSLEMTIVLKLINKDIILWYDPILITLKL
jgi:hypothetical protein